MCLFCINAFSSDIAETCQWRMEKSVVCTDRALLSQVSANEGRTIPAIAHAVWLESGKE